MEKRKAHKQELIQALTDAQKIAFAPLSFHAIGAMLDLGILKEVDTAPSSAQDLIEKLKLSEYTAKTLLETAEVIGIVKNQEDVYSITPLGKTFLYDEMTVANFNFVKDVCYSGASLLTQSFTEAEPKGLRQIFSDAETIYPYISKLPDRMKKSWYEFDHYYSNTCFDLICEIVSKSNKVFDIGGNTGIFEKVCLKNNPNLDITMIDLPANIDYIKNDEELKKCKFFKADVLKDELPQMSGAVFMSQFLDCFSKEQIRKILEKIHASGDDSIKVYILEPFIDRQKFEGAKYSLVHTSLYFTCMANGCSKMYSQKDMEKIINLSGFRINKVYEDVGTHDYTLLECVKNA